MTMVSNMVKTTPAGELIDDCPRLLNEIERDGKARRRAHFAHRYEYIGDIEAPLGVEWKMMKDD